jgi:hypothetical protein
MGGFAAPTKLRDAAGAVVSGDLDGDGKPDLVQAVSSGLEVRLVKTATWQPAATFTNWVGWFLVQDFDGDTKLDVVALEDDFSGQQTLHYLRGRGDGTFEDPVSTAQQVGYGVDAADLDHDGDLDLVTSLGGVSAFLFDAGKFGAAITTAATKLQYLRDLKVADFDRDDKPDVAYSGGYGLVVLRGDGAGHFTDVFDFPVGYVEALAVGDLDGDGRVDLFGNGEGQWFGRNITGLP